MKITTLIIIVIFSSLIFISCNNTTNENTGATTVMATEGAEHQHHEGEAIALNNGEKWKVDDNMMIYIKNMENDVNTFNTQRETDYETLAKKLAGNIELLTSNCTMKGQAHDELHKWLLPFIDLSDEFSDSKTEQETAASFQKIKASFVTFNTYFQ